jgi:L-serine deaminase
LVFSLVLGVTELEFEVTMEIQNNCQEFKNIKFLKVKLFLLETEEENDKGNGIRATLPSGQCGNLPRVVFFKFLFTKFKIFIKNIDIL